MNCDQQVPDVIMHLEDLRKRPGLAFSVQHLAEMRELTLQLQVSVSALIPTTLCVQAGPGASDQLHPPGWSEALILENAGPPAGLFVPRARHALL